METKAYDNFRKSAISFAFMMLVLISLLLYGMKSASLSGYMVSFESVRYSSIRDMLIGEAAKCFPDIFMLFMICALKDKLSLSAAVFIMAFRGLVLGRVIAFSIVNIVTYSAVAHMTSYALVTLVMLCVSIAVNYGEMNGKSKILMYFLVSGVFSLANILPAVLLH